MNRPINILIVCGKTFYPNPFITTLACAINSSSFPVDMGTDEFWLMRKHYDIIHVNWPEIFFNWRIPTLDGLRAFTTVLQIWKQRGTKIVYTRHDEKSHYCTNENSISLFRLMEDYADVVVHLGIFSRDKLILENRQCEQLHMVVPHHNYDSIYRNNISKKEARQVFNIPADKIVMLAFGGFRHEEEYTLVQNAFDDWDNPDKFLLAPSWNYSDGYTPSAGMLGTGTVDENMLPYCFAASDIVFIQRLRLLNSGNLPMAFLFNKTVVGPAIGNITALLDNENNFSFDPFDRKSVNNAMNKAVNRLRQGTQSNVHFAKDNWSLSIISEKYKQIYLAICSI